MNTTELQDRIRNLTYDVRINIWALRNITIRQIAIMYDIKYNIIKVNSLTNNIEV